MSIDVVYHVMRHTHDDGIHVDYIGLGKTVEEALLSSGLSNEDIQSWMQEDNTDIRLHCHVNAYDMTTTPPSLVARLDLRYGGGPVRDA